MIKLRKVICLCISSILLLSSALYVNAASVDSNNLEELTAEKSVVNEYSKLKELQKKSSKDLKAANYSNTEIDELKNMDIKKEYGEYIKEMSKYSEVELKGFNYTDTQINAIKNYDGSEQMTVAAASTVYVYTSKSSYSYSSSTNKTTATIGYSFSWNGQPLWKFTDAMAFCWSEGMYIDTSKSTCSVKYYYNAGPNAGTLTSRSYSVRAEGAGVGAASAFFPTLIDANNVCVINSGSGKISLYKIGKVPMFALRASYMHRIFTLGSASFSFPGGVSITPGTNTEESAYSLRTHTL